MARPARLTPPKQAEFLAVLVQTGNVTVAASLCGIGRRTAYDLRDRDATFSKQWDEAIEEAVDALELEARRRAVEGVDDPVYHRGKVVGFMRRYSDNLLIFLLKGAAPHKYRDGNVAVPHSGRVSHALRPVREQVSATAAWITATLGAPGTGPAT